MADKKISVAYFQRKPRKFGNYSVEFIFNDVRPRISHLINPITYYSRFESSGVFKRLYNALEASFRQKMVNHVTGDINYIGIFLSPHKTIHTILDCVFLNDTSGLKRKVLKYFWLTIPIKRSKFITAISESTKREIVKHSRCNPNKIIVIPVAISERFRRCDRPFNALNPTILQIGTAPNKNIKRLIVVLSKVNCHLIIIGKHEVEYEELLKVNGISYSYRSGLTDEEMLQQYNEADIISFCSTYEGFGMPILEGQTVGKVVVTSNLLSMPEVAGDAACLVDPYDTESIRQGIQRVIDDSEFRELLIMRGYENIKRYHPQLIAEQYCDLYNRVQSD